jgi:hypothetical protein
VTIYTTRAARIARASLAVAVALFLIFVAACNIETVEPSQGHVQLYVPERQFREIKPGMTANQVTQKIGAARRKELGSDDVWVFGVWRGDKPSVVRWLFTSSPIKQATVLEGRIRFRNGRVIGIEVDESSAVPLGAHPHAASPTVQPNSG